ncbi:hypothetical protein [Caldibacillus debilis]|uniref:Uncharacterized protein n=1 Tax=Caldibacillus debilis GB1 TaxID=1339248 RepID=A0A420VDP6_9BACI|nr:hypothetical protein [Caldibacillus debilis]RKO61665.1 hypothetical protein Cdeb_01136 [Caldibacillus debilis GB1]
MTDREYLAEAREWLEHIKNLTGWTAVDSEKFLQRMKTLEWLIEQAEEAEKYEDIGIRHERLKNEYLELQRKATEFIEKLNAKVEHYEKALYALYKMADDSEADLMIDVLVDTLKGYGFEKHFEEMYREGKQRFMEAGW